VAGRPNAQPVQSRDLSLDSHGAVSGRRSFAAKPPRGPGFQPQCHLIFWPGRKPLNHCGVRTRACSADTRVVARAALLHNLMLSERRRTRNINRHWDSNRPLKAEQPPMKIDAHTRKAAHHNWPAFCLAVPKAKPLITSATLLFPPRNAACPRLMRRLSQTLMLKMQPISPLPLSAGHSLEIAKHAMTPGNVR
jgi:hypothetical protein